MEELMVLLKGTRTVHTCTADLLLVKDTAETSINSDICDFSKNSDIGKSIVLNGETHILNDTTQFREDLKEIYRKLYYNRDI